MLKAFIAFRIAVTSENIGDDGDPLLINAVDVALIKVGEKTGTLSETAKFLQQFYDERAA